MLSEQVSPDRLRKILIPRDTFQPFPQPTDRESWIAIPEEIRQAHIQRGEKAIGFEWPAINADLFLDFVRTGNQQEDINLWGIRRTTLCDLVIAVAAALPRGRPRWFREVVADDW